MIAITLYLCITSRSVNTEPKELGLNHINDQGLTGRSVSTLGHHAREVDPLGPAKRLLSRLRLGPYDHGLFLLQRDLSHLSELLYTAIDLAKCGLVTTDIKSLFLSELRL